MIANSLDGAFPKRIPSVNSINRPSNQPNNTDTDNENNHK